MQPRSRIQSAKRKARSVSRADGRASDAHRQIDLQCGEARLRENAARECRRAHSLEALCVAPCFGMNHPRDHLERLADARAGMKNRVFRITKDAPLANSGNRRI